ncbi:MAG TPA: hypothetical protein VHN77_05975 [Phycisphaerales bacterium]|nr:hypothetical protein [Phycisphaerales bacterium]
MKHLTPTIRARAVECAAAVAIVALGWYLLIKPAERSLANDRARVAAVREQVDKATVLTPSVERIKTEAARAADTVQSLRTAQRLTSISSRLYDAVNRLATASSVKVMRLDPAGFRQVAGPSMANAASSARGEVQEYRITVQGTYESVARFIHACEHSLGTSSVTKFRIAPIEDAQRDRVEATIETAHLRLIAAESGGDH